MSAAVICIPMEQHIPAGVMSQEPVDVRAFLVPHATGLVLVDTGMNPSGDALDGALAAAGASWADVPHVVLTHGHPDHTGALARVREAASGARVMASPLEGIQGTDSLVDGAPWAA